MAFQVGNQEADVSVEFPNLTGIANSSDIGDPTSRVPVKPDIAPKDDREPLYDWAQRRMEERSIIEERIRLQHWQRNEKVHEIPEPDFWGPDRLTDASSKIPDYSHLVSPSDIPDYSHLVSPDELEAQQSQAMAPTTMHILNSIKDTIPHMYEQIKNFKENPTPEEGFKIALQLVGGGVAAGLERAGTLGVAGGKPPIDYFKKPANENTPLRTPEINPVTEAELMSSATLKQRMQQQAQAIRQKAIESGRIEDKGSVVKEMESTLKWLKLDREAHDLAGFLSKGDLRELDKEIASVEEMISVFKSKSGSVVPIDIKEMQATKPQEPQAQAGNPISPNTIKVYQEAKKQLQEVSDQIEVYGKAVADIKKAKPETLKGIEKEVQEVKDLHKQLLDHHRDLSIQVQKLEQELLKEANKPQSMQTKPQEPQAKAKGVHWKEEDKEFVRKSNAKGMDAESIAKMLTINRMAAKEVGAEVSTEKVKNLIKAEGLVTPEAIRRGAIRAEVKAQDYPILGVQRSQQEIHEAVQAKFPEQTRTATNSLLDRQRALRRSEAAMAEKYGIDLKPREMAQQQKSGESIFKPVGQEEFDFHAPARPTYPKPDVQQAKREMLFARDTFANFKKSIIDKATASAQTLEEMRLRGMLYDRAKELHATVSQIAKEEKSGDLLGKHAREYLEGRVQAYQGFIADLKEQIFGVQMGRVYSARDAELRKSILQESPSGMIERGGKQGPVIPMGRNSNPYKD